MTTRIYTSEQAVLDYDSSVPCITLTFLKFQLEEEFRKVLNIGHDFLKDKIKETGKMLWMSDTSLSPVFNENDPKWAAEDWTPRVLKAGLRHVTFVVPSDELAKIAVDEYKEFGSKEGMIIAYFKDVESAKNWFKELKQ
jgi:hypothetical protein